MLRQELDRRTKDCDLGAIDPSQHEDALNWAAGVVALEIGLESQWLNTQAVFFADYLPQGWKARADRLGTFGPLTVLLLSRGDLIASKAFGILKDKKHLQDFYALEPTEAEIRSCIQNVEEVAAREREDMSHIVAALQSCLPPQ